MVIKELLQFLVTKINADLLESIILYVGEKRRPYGGGVIGISMEWGEVGKGERKAY